MYQFKEEINRDAHFWFKKKWITDLNWKMLPKSTKAIFPVIAVHQNKDGESFPSELTIAIYSGRTEKVVRRGIEALRHFPDITQEPYVTQRGRRSKRFIFKPIIHQKGNAFPFYRDIIDGGNWLMLKPISQAVYPVMRHYGYFEPDIYSFYYPDSFCDPEEFTADFRDRECDFCEADPHLIVDLAGISYKSYDEALYDLEKHYLIEHTDNNLFKVYLHPPKIYKREFLNRKILERYGNSDD